MRSRVSSVSHSRLISRSGRTNKTSSSGKTSRSSKASSSIRSSRTRLLGGKPNPIPQQGGKSVTLKMAVQLLRKYYENKYGTK